MTNRLPAFQPPAAPQVTERPQSTDASDEACQGRLSQVNKNSSPDSPRTGPNWWAIRDDASTRHLSDMEIDAEVGVPQSYEINPAAKTLLQQSFDDCIYLLNRPDPMDRKNSAEDLYRYAKFPQQSILMKQHPALLTALINNLNDSDRDVRNHVVTVLLQLAKINEKNDLLAKHPDLMSGLISHLDSSDGKLVRNSTMLIHKLKKHLPSALNAEDQRKLTRVLENDIHRCGPNPPHSHYFLKSIKELQKPEKAQRQHDDPLTALTNSLNSADPDVQTQALRTLTSQLNSPDLGVRTQAASALTENINNSDPNVRRMAWVTLSSLLSSLQYHENSTAFLHLERELLTVLTNKLNDSSRDVRMEGLIALDTLKHREGITTAIPENEALLTALTNSLNSADLEIQIQALRTLAGLSTHENNKTLLAQQPGLLTGLINNLPSSDFGIVYHTTCPLLQLKDHLSSVLDEDQMGNLATKLNKNLDACKDNSIIVAWTKQLLAHIGGVLSDK